MIKKGDIAPLEENGMGRRPAKAGQDHMERAYGLRNRLFPKDIFSRIYGVSIFF